MNPYYDPEKFGLQVIGEVDYSSGSYEFDLTVVWRDMTSGRLLYADDSGCSCPAPFEQHGVDAMTPATPHEIGRELTARIDATCSDFTEAHVGCRCGENCAKVARLMELVHEAVRA